VKGVLKLKIFIPTILSAILLFSLSACNSSSGGSTTKNQASTISNSSDTSNKNTHSNNDFTTTNKNGTTNKETSSAHTGNQATNQPTGAWVKTFEKELYNGYHVTPSHYKYIGNGNWEVWVKEVDTDQNPYVTVNQNTGDFHG